MASEDLWDSPPGLSFCGGIHSAKIGELAVRMNDLTVRRNGLILKVADTNGAIIRFAERIPRRRPAANNQLPKPHVNVIHVFYAELRLTGERPGAKDHAAEAAPEHFPIEG